MILTHFSARVPDAENQFLLNAYGLMFDEVTASNLVKIDHQGNIVEDITGFGVNQAGFVIHGCVHEARPEIKCVLHTHTRAGIAVAASTEGLLPLSPACRACWWAKSPTTTTRASRSTWTSANALANEPRPGYAAA